LQCTIPWRSDGSFISLDNFETIIGKLRKHGCRKIVLSGGEPAIHPQLEELFALLQQYGYSNPALLSNLYYSEAMQHKVIDLALRYNVSINTSYDGLGEVADFLRRASKVQESVERGMMHYTKELAARGIKGKPTATLVISALNIHQVPEIIQRITQLGWNLNIDLYRWGSINHRENDVMKIKDKQQILNLLPLITSLPNLRTPIWYYEGLERMLNGSKTKQCPYLISPTFGSKFFINEHGDIHTCLPKPIGNLLHQELKDIFEGINWRDSMKQYESCEGCWNSCYTLSSRALSYLHGKTIRQFLHVPFVVHAAHNKRLI
jgi:MoaA/NifB/PqqE/SkfB family radical SAM enzyme